MPSLSRQHTKEHEDSVLFPPVGASIRVSRDEHSVDCVVESVSSETFDVVLPGGGWVLDDGVEVVASWLTGRGLCSVDATLETQGLGIWTIRPRGEVHSVQRRSYVRIQASVRLQIHLRGGVVVHAHTKEVSEGGCSLRLPEDVEHDLQAGQQVRVALLLGTPLRMRGEVVRIKQRPTGGDELALKFLEPYDSDELRTWVLRAQVLRRARKQA